MIRPDLDQLEVTIRRIINTLEPEFSKLTGDDLQILKDDIGYNYHILILIQYARELEKINIEYADKNLEAANRYNDLSEKYLNEHARLTQEIAKRDDW